MQQLKYLLLFIISICNCNRIVAETNDAIFVWTSDTEYTCYLLNKTPTLTKDGDDVVLTVDGKETMRYPFTTAKNITITFGVFYPTIKLNDDGFATFSYKIDTKLPDMPVKAFTAKVEGDIIKCTWIEDGIIPAGNGVLLFGEAGASVTFTATNESTSLEDNDLLPTTLSDGSTSEVPSDGIVYSLTGKQFLRYTGKTFVPNKAYILQNADTNSKMRISFDWDETTGINIIQDDFSFTDGKDVYSINGCKVNKIGKGIYIVNGKKIIK